MSDSPIVALVRRAVVRYGSQHGLAAALGRSPSEISRYLCGVHRPRAPYVWALKQAAEHGPEWVAPWVKRPNEKGWT